MRWWVTLHAQESEEQLLPILFDVPAEGRGEFMTTVQISERLVTYGNIKKPMPLNRLGVLLGTAGYQKKAIGKQRIRGWLVYQRSTDEINANKNLYAKWADEQMSRCFYKVYHARIRVYILKKNCSSAHPLTQTPPYSPLPFTEG